MAEPEAIGCRDSCGSRSENPLAAGWQWLEITKSWRCPACVKALASINADERRGRVEWARDLPAEPNV